MGANTAAVDCAITASEIQVTVAGTKLMEGSLAATVVPEDCTWTVHRPQVANPDILMSRSPHEPHRVTDTAMDTVRFR